MGEVVSFPERKQIVNKGSAGMTSQIPGACVTVSSVSEAATGLIQRDIK